MCNFRRKVAVGEVASGGSAVVGSCVGGVDDCCGRVATLGSCVAGGSTLGSCVGGACGVVWSEKMLCSC